MNEIEQHRAAEEPLQVFEAEFPGARRRRLVTAVTIGLVVIVLVVGALLYVNLNHRVRQLDRTTAAQAVQIKHLQEQLASESASLGAAVACLQTVGATEGLCTKLAK